MIKFQKVQDLISYQILSNKKKTSLIKSHENEAQSNKETHQEGE